MEEYLKDFSKSELAEVKGIFKIAVAKGNNSFFRNKLCVQDKEIFEYLLLSHNIRYFKNILKFQEFILTEYHYRFIIDQALFLKNHQNKEILMAVIIQLGQKNLLEHFIDYYQGENRCHFEDKVVFAPHLTKNMLKKLKKSNILNTRSKAQLAENIIYDNEIYNKIANDDEAWEKDEVKWREYLIANGWF